MQGIVENKEHWLPGAFTKVSCQVQRWKGNLGRFEVVRKRCQEAPCYCEGSVSSGVVDEKHMYGLLPAPPRAFP